MNQDAYMAVYECKECKSKFILCYKYPSRKVEPFGGWCGHKTGINLALETALTPSEWFAEMEEKRGVAYG